MLKKLWLFCLFFFFLSSNLGLGQGLINFTGEYESFPPNYNQNKIIEDEAVYDYNSMTAEQIKVFIARQGGVLYQYTDPQTGLPAHQLIYQIAQEFRINPKFLLTMLQKEQSLITETNPTDNQYNWATGFSCYGGVCLDKYKGLSAQLRGTANKFMNSYLSDLNQYGKYNSNQYCTFTKWCVGSAKATQEGILITPLNKITAALYTYNPYRGNAIVDGLRIGGNYNFFKIWDRWFSGPLQPIVYRPNGSLIKAKNDPTVYLIEDSFRRPFANYSALVSRYNPQNIVELPLEEVSNYPLGKTIKFSQYSLLEDQNKQIFLLVDNTLKKIANDEVFRAIGFNPEEIITTQLGDLDGFSRGADITLADGYPTGTLVRDYATSGIYYVQSGTKYPIMSKEILLNNFPNYKIIKLKKTKLDAYPKGSPVKFKDNTLVKANGNPAVYVISNGQKLPFASEQAFISRGYDWDNIILTNQAALDIHPTGEPLNPIISKQ